MKLPRSLFPVAVACALAACHSKKEPATAEALPSVAIRTVLVEKMARPASEEVVGTVRAKLRAAIAMGLSRSSSDARRGTTLAQPAA